MGKAVQLLENGAVVRTKTVRVISEQQYRLPSLRVQAEAAAYPLADILAVELSTPVLVEDGGWKVGLVVPTTR